MKPVVTASVGKVSLLEEKPTCVNDPVVGTIYIDSVELKDTVVLFGEMAHAVLVESGSRVKVTLVATVAHEGAPVVPTYASPGYGQKGDGCRAKRSYRPRRISVHHLAHYLRNLCHIHTGRCQTLWYACEGARRRLIESRVPAKWQ